MGAPSGERSFPLGKSKVPPLESHHGYSVVNTLFPHDEAPTRLLVGDGWGPGGSELKHVKYDASMKICGYL